MAQRPNILFILLDDFGWRDLRCYGSTFYETPHLDKLASEGMLFTDAYASCPVCSPSRASIMSGKYPARVGVTDFIGGDTKGKLLSAPYKHELPLEEYSIARALHDGGYRTWHVGKWHLGAQPYYPQNHGFDVNIGGCAWGHPKQGYFSPYGIETMSDGPEGEYLTDRLTDEAIRLIRQPSDQPFFLNLWHYTVHTPIQAKQEDIDRFTEKARRMGLDKIDPIEEGEHFSCLHKAHLRVARRRLQSNPVYAAMVYNMDWNIGRLLQALEETGQADHTVIIFTSDNGGLATAEGSPTCNYPLMEGKGWMYEGGVREPLIVKWPGVVQPKTLCTVPVSSPDFYPTLLEIAGLPFKPEQHVDGVSLVPLFKGAQTLDRDSLFWHYPHYGNQGGTPGCSIRMGDYKLIEFFEDHRLELYQLRDDLSEQHNLVDELPELAQRMHQRLEQWIVDTQAILPTPNPDYPAETDAGKK